MMVNDGKYWHFLKVATKEDIQALIEFANEQLKERF